MTPLDLLVASIRARASTSDGMASPAAVLWTDPTGEWAGLLPVARHHMPELLTLGKYEPRDRSGPAIWLRCVVDGAITLPDMPDDLTPVLYLPEVEHGKLRAGDECAEMLRPLVELMYRGRVWHHPNGRHWTARGFLTLANKGVTPGPGLKIARDAATKEALLRALKEVSRCPVDDLRGRLLDAGDFNRMAGVDLNRDILRWLGEPNATRTQMDDNRWKAFRSQAHNKLGIDPEMTADVVAGAKLAQGHGRWGDVWQRYADTPQMFLGVMELLERSRPSDVLVLQDRERWPDLNREDEDAVLGALAGLPELPHSEACTKILSLEKAHAKRRDWVWAKLDQSPMAQLLEPLARLATATQTSIGGTTPDDIARVYCERGWQADMSAREALVNQEHAEGVIKAVVRHLLEPWLQESALALQAAFERHPSEVTGHARAVGSAKLAARGDKVAHGTRVAHPSEPITAREGECILFVDGLRYELGQCLTDHLTGQELSAAIQPRWAALPTVTATAKPAVTPVSGDIEGRTLGADFSPTLRETGQPSTAAVLRGAMEQRGYSMRPDGLELGPAPNERGWRETGRIDQRGHQQGAVEFADSVERELRHIARHIQKLIDDGWRAVRIVTDHGWLLLPGGLPMVSLPNHLTESKWARCAVLAGDARPGPGAPLHPWHWNPAEYFASPPGIACFSKRPEYAHGGLSLQECLIPDIRITRSNGTQGAIGYRGVRAVIKSASWMRMRCNVLVEGSVPGATVDLRLGSASGASVASRTKPIDDDGCASLILTDDDNTGDLVIVVLGPQGQVLAQRTTRKGATSA